MQTVIYLVRHGQFKNPKNILPGRMKGFPLSENGIGQITDSARFLKNKDIDYLYSSPILRTRQSAQIIKRILKLKRINITADIIEIKSSYDGSSRVEMAKTNFDFYSPKNHIAGDETISMIEKRMRKFLNRILKAHPGKTTVATTHADPIMILRASILKMPMSLNSIRDPEKDYAKFGDIFKITSDSEKGLSIKKVFSPH